MLLPCSKRFCSVGKGCFLKNWLLIRMPVCTKRWRSHGVPLLWVRGELQWLCVGSLGLSSVFELRRLKWQWEHSPCGDYRVGGDMKWDVGLILGILLLGSEPCPAEEVCVESTHLSTVTQNPITFCCLITHLLMRPIRSDSVAVGWTHWSSFTKALA